MDKNDTANRQLTDVEPSTSLDVAAQVRGVLDELAARPTHDPATGKFIPGALAAGTSLQHSETFWTAVAVLKHEIVERVARDLALTDDAVMTLCNTVDAYAEAFLLRKAMFLRLTELGGPVTAKGAARSLYRAYCAAMDRELKLAQTLGFERKQKPVDLAQAFAAQERSRG